MAGSFSDVTGRSIDATIHDTAREVEPIAVHCGNEHQALDVSAALSCSGGNTGENS
jgi:hypothetical protein